MSEIAPCPNPECDRSKHVHTLMRRLDGRVEMWSECLACGLRAPYGPDDPHATIAAWNSISMGWLPGKTAPKDGTWFLAPLRFEKEWRWVPCRYLSASGTIEYVAYAEQSQEPEYLYGDRVPKHWHPIPPLPEGE